MKHYSQQQAIPARRKNAKVQVSRSKPSKDPKESILIQLKNQELQEEKAKNAELRRHIEILKKRVYAKMEFEGQSKTIREASTMLENLKVITLLIL